MMRLARVGRDAVLVVRATPAPTRPGPARRSSAQVPLALDIRWRPRALTIVSARVILAGMSIKTSRVVGVILLGLLVALVLPMLDVNSTLSDFIAFAVVLVGVWVLSAREERRRRREAVARDEARAGGEASGRQGRP